MSHMTIRNLLLSYTIYYRSTHLDVYILLFSENYINTHCIVYNFVRYTLTTALQKLVLLLMEKKRRVAMEYKLNLLNCADIDHHSISYIQLHIPACVIRNANQFLFGSPTILVAISVGITYLSFIYSEIQTIKIGLNFYITRRELE